MQFQYSARPLLERNLNLTKCATISNCCLHQQVRKSLRNCPKSVRMILLRRSKNDDTITFRPVTDGIFIHAGMIDYLKSPEFAVQFKRCDSKLLIGEVLNEETMYSTYYAPRPTRNPSSNYRKDSAILQLTQIY